MSEGRMRAFLFASVAVNLLLVGGLAGAYLAGVRIEKPGVERAERPERRGGGFMRGVDPAAREKLRGALAGAWTGSREERRKAMQARDEVARAAQAEPYDPAAVSAALARQREADAGLQAAWHEAMARALSNLSPEERRAAVRALVHERRRMFRGVPPGAAGERSGERSGERFRERLREGAPPAPPAPPAPEP